MSQIQQFIKDHESDDIRSLALQAKRYPEIDMPFALQQIAGRQITKEKVPVWYACDRIIYPKHISLEQCSSQNTAQFKASLYDGYSLTDLTGGMGVDFSFMATRYLQATYVEQQTELVQLANHNFRELGLANATIVAGDAVTYLQSMSPVDLIYIDPARRDTKGQKTVLIEDCTPNIVDIEVLLEEKSKRTMIKLSPMLDISLALKSIRNVSDVYIISSNNECKELLFVKENDINDTNDTHNSPLLHCVNILKDRIHLFTFTKIQEENLQINYTACVSKYLYEPNSSLIKGGAYKSISKRYNLHKLHINSHLYTSDELQPDFEGRKFIVDGVSSLNKNELKPFLSQISQANIATRNFPLSPQELRKRLKLNDGGDVYIFGTTLDDGKKVLIFCRKA